MAVGGDTAGGNLAAAVTHLLRDAGGPRPLFQPLVYPIAEYLADTDSAVGQSEETIGTARPRGRPL
jgi:acetyl esterase